MQRLYGTYLYIVSSSRRVDGLKLSLYRTDQHHIEFILSRTVFMVKYNWLIFIVIQKLPLNNGWFDTEPIRRHDQSSSRKQPERRRKQANVMAPYSRKLTSIFKNMSIIKCFIWFRFTRVNRMVSDHFIKLINCYAWMKVKTGPLF